MASYHDSIQAKAREIELDRGKTYGHSGTLIYTEAQLTYLYGAIYKLLRVKNKTKTKEKALDDALDAYNYIALFYEDLSGAPKADTINDQRVAVSP